MKTNYILLSLVFVFALSFASADNLANLPNSNQLVFVQNNGIVLTPTTTCSDQIVEKQVCAPDYISCVIPDPTYETTVVEKSTLVTPSETCNPYDEQVIETVEVSTPIYVSVIVDYTWVCIGSKAKCYKPVYSTIQNGTDTTYENITRTVHYDNCTTPEPYLMYYNETTTIQVNGEEICELKSGACETVSSMENVCTTTYTKSYNRTTTPVMKAWATNDTNFVTEFESGLMAENIYTQSKTAKLSGADKKDYLSIFNNRTKLETKANHYAKKVLSFEILGLSLYKTEDVLDLEERVVSLEGAMNQMMVENCVKNKNAYSYCNGLVA